MDASIAHHSLPMSRAGAAPRACLLLTDAYVPEVGGTIVWFENVLRRLDACEAHVVTRTYPGRPRAETIDGIKVWRTPLRRHPFLKPESLALYFNLTRSAWRVARATRPQAILAGKVLPEGLVAKWVSRLTGIPYVVFAHGEDTTIFGANPAYRNVMPAVYRGAAANIANSDFTRRQLEALGVASGRIRVVNPGVDTELFAPAPPDPELVRRLRLEGKTVLLSVGRLTRRKGHDHVLRALPAVLAQVPELVYVVVSDGEEAASLRALAAELGVEAAVRFVGEVPYRELPKLYNACDVSVMANRELPGGHLEGFGIVFLEANACGKPAIAGTSGGTGDAIEHDENGLRIDGNDIDAIRDAIVALALDRPRREALGARGLARVRGRHTWAAVTARIEAILTHVNESPAERLPG